MNTQHFRLKSFFIKVCKSSNFSNKNLSGRVTTICKFEFTFISKVNINIGPK